MVEKLQFIFIYKSNISTESYKHENLPVCSRSVLILISKAENH